MGDTPEGLRNRVFCSSCGTSEARRGGTVPIGWQEMPDQRGRQLAICPDCTRRSLWLIESRFDLDFGSGTEF